MMRKNKNNIHKVIRRIIVRDNHGWIVTIVLKGKSKRIFFADKRYGGIAQARQEARTYQFRHMIRLGYDPKKIIIIYWIEKYNKEELDLPSGIIYVRRRTYSENMDSHFRATVFTTDGLTRYKTFSILKYGKDEALRLAKSINHRGKE